MFCDELGEGSEAFMSGLFVMWPVVVMLAVGAAGLAAIKLVV